MSGFRLQETVKHINKTYSEYDNCYEENKTGWTVEGLSRVLTLSLVLVFYLLTRVTIIHLILLCFRPCAESDPREMKKIQITFGLKEVCLVEESCEYRAK